MNQEEINAKARELVEKYSKFEIQIGGQYDGYLTMQIDDAKQCALIACDEIIHYLEIVLGVDKSDFEFWYKVKQAIENL